MAQEAMITLETKRTEKETQILNLQQKQAQTLKTLRDGYVSAISAMTAGTGMFAKVMIDQNKNLGIGVKYLGMVQSMRSGGVDPNRSVGIRQASQFNTQGTITGVSDEERLAAPTRPTTAAATLLSASRTCRRVCGTSWREPVALAAKPQPLARTPYYQGAALQAGQAGLPQQPPRGQQPTTAPAPLQPTNAPQQPQAQQRIPGMAVPNVNLLTNVAAPAVPDSTRQIGLLTKLNETAEAQLDVLEYIASGGTGSPPSQTGSAPRAPGFHDGGIVRGYEPGGVFKGDYSNGDTQIIKVAGGEMILTPNQQGQIARTVGMDQTSFRDAVKGRDFTRIEREKSQRDSMIERMVPHFMRGGVTSVTDRSEVLDHLVAEKNRESTTDRSRDYRSDSTSTDRDHRSSDRTIATDLRSDFRSAIERSTDTSTAEHFAERNNSISRDVTNLTSAVREISNTSSEKEKDHRVERVVNNRDYLTREKLVEKMVPHYEKGGVAPAATQAVPGATREMIVVSKDAAGNTNWHVENHGDGPKTTEQNKSNEIAYNIMYGTKGDLRALKREKKMWLKPDPTEADTHSQTQQQADHELMPAKSYIKKYFPLVSGAQEGTVLQSNVPVQSPVERMKALDAEMGELGVSYQKQLQRGSYLDESAPLAARTRDLMNRSKEKRLRTDARGITDPIPQTKNLSGFWQSAKKEKAHKLDYLRDRYYTLHEEYGKVKKEWQEEVNKKTTKEEETLKRTNEESQNRQSSEFQMKLAMATPNLPESQKTIQQVTASNGGRIPALAGPTQQQTKYVSQLDMDAGLEKHGTAHAEVAGR
jgi:hypothetical protein